MHQIMNFGVRTAYIDLQRGISPLGLGFLRQIGIYDLVGTEGWGMQGHVPNTGLVDATYETKSERRAIIDELYRLATDPKYPTAHAEDFTWYRYAGALSGYTHCDPVGAAKDASTFRPLQEVPEELVSDPSLRGLARILNWRKWPMRSEVWGEMVIPMSVPDSRHWPE